MEICNEHSLNIAAEILSKVTPESGIILILGNQVSPVPIMTFRKFRSELSEGNDILVEYQEAQDRYFDFLESFRLRTSTVLPHRNMVSIMRLVQKGIVKAVITTNYDCHIRSVFTRYGGSYRCTINPCIPNEEIDHTWDCDGYWSSDRLDIKEIPLWKIHGDLAFVRMASCAHVFRLPQFRVGHFRQNDVDQAYQCHLPVFTKGGGLFPDPSLYIEHPTGRYEHHIDFLVTRNLFSEEVRAAKQQLLAHADAGGAIFIFGLTAPSRFPEDLVPVISKTNRRVPIVYVLASKEPVKSPRNELLLELSKRGREFTLVNEITTDNTLHDAIEEIVTRSGETGIDSEWQDWKTQGKWWTE